MIKVTSKGDYSKITGYLERLKEHLYLGTLNKYGRQGVSALAAATPVDTGLLASSWYYEIENSNGLAKLIFCNSDIEGGAPIAIIVQYGHGTRNGGWVEGRDYINPALQPIFDEIAEDIWKEVTRI